MSHELSLEAYSICIVVALHEFTKPDIMDGYGDKIKIKQHVELLKLSAWIVLLYRCL